MSGRPPEKVRPACPSCGADLPELEHVAPGDPPIFVRCVGRSNLHTALPFECLALIRCGYDAETRSRSYDVVGVRTKRLAS